MNAEETEIYEFLKKFSNLFVSVNEISKNVGARKKFNEDRNWTLPILRRMEMEGWVEANPFGDYRLKRRPDDTTTFKRALSMPDVPLGDTAIITLEEETQRIENIRLNQDQLFDP
jgi:hypothetical protein